MSSEGLTLTGLPDAEGAAQYAAGRPVRIQACIFKVKVETKVIPGILKSNGRFCNIETADWMSVLILPKDRISAV